MTTEDAMAAVTLLDEIMTTEEIRRLRDKIACEEETCTALEVQIARTRDTLAERRAELVRLRKDLDRARLSRVPGWVAQLRGELAQKQGKRS